MRRILTSALLLIVSTSLSQAAESSAPSSGSQKSGSRSTEGAKKSTSPTPGQSAGNPGGASGTETPKKKAPVTKPAPAKTGTEDERFANARKAAAEDPKVVELREKADLAKTEEAGTKAMRAYLRALYAKMRALEPSLEGRINLTEAAALKAVSKQE